MADTPITPDSGGLVLVGVAPRLDFVISTQSGTLVLSGKGIAPRLPVYQLNGTDAVTTSLLGPYQLNGTDIVNGVVLGPYELPGGSISIIVPVGSLSFTGIATDVANSGILDVTKTPAVSSLALTGLAPSLIIGTVRQPLVGTLTLTGIASFRAPTAEVSWEPWTATGLLIPGGLASSDGVSWAPWRSEGILTSPIVMSAEMAWAPWTAHATFKFSAAVEFAPWTASGSLSELLRGSGSWAPWRKRNISGAPFWPAWTASARLQVMLSEVYTTKVMNTRNTAITEYSNYAFNSFAKIGNYYYGAGPNGLIRLSGATDNGSDIAWAVRTGQMADEKTNLKRLIDVLIALRSNGPIRVRVHKDDSTYYDYVLPPIKPDTIHQHRVTPGKGMRSKYYMIELQGVNNADLELDSLLASMVETNRRLG